MFYPFMIVVSSIFLFFGIVTNNDKLVLPMFILLLVSVATLDVLAAIKKINKEGK